MTRNEGRHRDDEARGKNGTHETVGLFEKERRDCVVKMKKEAEAEAKRLRRSRRFGGIDTMS